MPCKALVMSGGSNYGAWEVGVLWGLAHYGDPKDFEYDVVSGVSAGSINTAGTAGWAPDEFVEMTEYMSDAWLNIKSSDVWVFWDNPLSLPFQKSLLDDSPALETLREIMSVRSEFKRRVSVGTVSLNKGEFITFN